MNFSILHAEWTVVNTLHRSNMRRVSPLLWININIEVFECEQMYYLKQNLEVIVHIPMPTKFGYYISQSCNVLVVCLTIISISESYNWLVFMCSILYQMACIIFMFILGKMWWGDWILNTEVFRSSLRLWFQIPPRFNLYLIFSGLRKLVPVARWGRCNKISPKNWALTLIEKLQKSMK